MDDCSSGSCDGGCDAGLGKAHRLGLLLVAGYLIARSMGLLEILRDASARGSALSDLRSAASSWWVGPAFSLAYAGVVAVALPASILILVRGVAFGLLQGVLWGTLGANFGASAGFWMARRLGRSALEGFFGSRLRAFDRVSGAAGFSGVLTLRLLPVAPFSLRNSPAG